MALIVFVMLYDVTFRFDMAFAREVQQADLLIETAYMRCYQQQDEAMHDFVFGTVDNPDVQKEFIITNRERIARDCREQFPEQLISVRQPSRFKLMDLKPRFW